MKAIHKRAAVAGVAAVLGLGALVGCSEYNDERGKGDGTDR